MSYLQNNLISGVRLKTIALHSLLQKARFAYVTLSWQYLFKDFCT